MNNRNPYLNQNARLQQQFHQVDVFVLDGRNEGTAHQRVHAVDVQLLGLVLVLLDEARNGRTVATLRTQQELLLDRRQDDLLHVDLLVLLLEVQNLLHRLVLGLRAQAHQILVRHDDGSVGIDGR